MTDKQGARDEFRPSQSTSQALVAAQAATFVWDVGPDVVSWSAELLRLYGLESGALDPSLEAWRDCLVAEDREAAMAATRNALEGGVFELEFRIRRGDTGDIRWLYGRAARLLDESGKPAQLVGVHFDLTERKERNEGLVQSVRKHERQVQLLEDGIYEYIFTPVLDSAGEVEIIDGTTRDITERKQAEQALRASEERYRTLFESVDEGFCIVEMLFDDSGHPQDYRFLEANPAFERQTGLVGAVGKTMRELAPTHEAYWFETYGRIALTGIPERFEGQAAALGRHYDVYALRVGTPQQRRVAILFRDIGEHKKAELALRMRDTRQAFLLRLDDALRPIEDPEEICFEAARVLGEHMSANRVGYAECVEGSSTVVIGRHFSNGVIGVEGVHHLDDLGLIPRSSLLSGRIFVAADVASDPTLSEAEKAVYARLAVVSMAGVPVVKNGRLAAVLFCHYGTPHGFVEPEVSLMEVVAERTWAAVERARAAAAVRDSETRFRALVTATSDVMYRMSVDWSEMRQLHGRDFIADTESPSRTWLDDYIPPGEQAKVMAAINEAVRTKGIFELEHRVLRVDGSVGWTFSRAIPVQDRNGEIIEWFGAASDITRRKESVEALRESEQQFRDLANAIPQLCWMANADGWVAWYNDRWYDYTGMTPAQMEGWGWQSVHDPVALPNVLARWKESIATGRPFDMVFPLRGADGVFRPFLTRVMPVFDQDGKLARWFGTNTDISEQRKTEDALRESEERLRLAQQAGGIGTFDWNVRTGVNTWTPELERLYGLPPGGFTGTQTAWEDLIHPEDRAQAIARVDLAFQTGEPGGGEWRVIWPDRSIHWLAGQYRVLRDDSGAPLRLTGANIDITHRKHLEEQVRQAQKMESIGRLAGSVAHDFNNLLTIITGYSQMVLDDLASHHPLREPVKEVSLAAERATALTRQLLAFSRRQVTEPRNVLLNDLLRDLERMLRRLIGEEVALELVLDADTGVIRADPGQIEQVVMNLVINAKDAMPNGGRVLVESSRQVFDPQSAEGQLSLSPGAYAVLAVSDTGIGMSPEVKSHIFEPFFTTKEQGKGTGLGLSTVYGIVQQSDGAISVYSEPGKGTTFKILLPASDSPPDESSLAEDGSIGHLGSGTILVAEDEPGVRDFICRTLTRHGYSVLAAPNGIEAMALLRRHGSPVDLLLTDVAMPEMGGVELSTQFSAAHPQVPVLLMSGYAERLLSEHLAGRHIQKPFTSAALLTRIGALLRHP